MNVKIGAGGKEISWDYNGQTVKRNYSDTLLGYEVLPDGTGILLLEPVSEVGPENAVILNVDGTTRWRLPFPHEVGIGKLFDRVGVAGGQLLVVGIVNGRDVKFEIDYKKLIYSDVSATR